MRSSHFGPFRKREGTGKYATQIQKLSSPYFGFSEGGGGRQIPNSNKIKSKANMLHEEFSFWSVGGERGRDVVSTHLNVIRNTKTHLYFTQLPDSRL